MTSRCIVEWHSSEIFSNYQMRIDELSRVWGRLVGNRYTAGVFFCKIHWCIARSETLQEFPIYLRNSKYSREFKLLSRFIEQNHSWCITKYVLLNSIARRDTTFDLFFHWWNYSCRLRPKFIFKTLILVWRLAVAQVADCSHVMKLEKYENYKRLQYNGSRLVPLRDAGTFPHLTIRRKFQPFQDIILIQ